jgi:RNA polymerase sigma-70 factor (ECF subfamily)
MELREPDTDELLAEAASGDAAARGRLLDRHRRRLRGLFAVRMDPRLAARVDPSDLVQETLAEAHRRLEEYLRERPLAFYPWLRQLALDRLIDLHRRHVRSGKRAVGREDPGGLFLSDDSLLELSRRLAGSGSAPSARLRREERRRRLQAALDQLGPRDREILVLRYLEQLRPRDIAAVLGVNEAVVYTRHLRALERLRRLLGPTDEECP